MRTFEIKMAIILPIGQWYVDSIAVSLFGNMTVEPREIHIITKE